MGGLIRSSLGVLSPKINQRTTMKAVFALLLICLIQISFAEEQESIDSEIFCCKGKREMLQENVRPEAKEGNVDRGKSQEKGKRTEEGKAEREHANQKEGYSKERGLKKRDPRKKTEKEIPKEGKERKSKEKKRNNKPMG